MTASPWSPLVDQSVVADGDRTDAVVPSLAAHLRDWRSRHDVTHGEVARRLGVARTTVRNWEMGRRPQPLQLLALSRFFGWDLATARAITGRDRVRTARTSGGCDASPLCRARLAVGLTMTQVANRVRVSPAAVSRWENGIRRPSPAYRPALARALRLGPEELAALLDASPVGRWDGEFLPRLGRLRRDQGLTQREFAARLAIGSTTAHRWENGDVRVPQPRLGQVADVLGLPPEQVVATAAGAILEPAAALSPLARMRAAAGMTQREVAHHVGFSIRTLRRLEQGKRPAVATARALARCYRRGLSDVLRATGVEVPVILAQRAWRPGDLPSVIEALRVAAGLSAAELGRRLGTSGRQVRSWERGMTLPSRAACQRLELLHQCSPGQLQRLCGPF